MSTPLQGVLLQLTALAFFVAMDTVIKYLTGVMPVPQIMFGRFLFHLIVVAIAIRVATGSLPWRTRAPKLQTIRSLCLFGANFIFSTALFYIPLADATAVGFAAPALTVAMAAIFLHERVGWLRWVGVAVGFAGVLVALRPPILTGESAPHWATVLPLFTALIFSVYQILTRKLATIDNARTTVLHTSFAALCMTAVIVPFVWVPVPGWVWGAFLGLGLLGGIGHFLLVLAYTRAPASLLGPLHYTQLIWASISGALVFGQWPSLWTLAGAVIMALGAVLVALPRRRT
ncbi:threonine/homoserine efflux transporter RhtA [Humitalea rosea]|uniref:Threonine/homoserine efflux transporter RhtA n=1 Tax=Humitalea rosea TaxID=990373 RepID=A0A2W7IC74_9PROT|nr:DMT family transporter [Humitalea rosea]PZW43172.1 threonine/homoserine efflux transporter RhtA [Humitalea rosea]